MITDLIKNLDAFWRNHRESKMPSILKKCSAAYQTLLVRLAQFPTVDIGQHPKIQGYVNELQTAISKVARDVAGEMRPSAFIYELHRFQEWIIPFLRQYEVGVPIGGQNESKIFEDRLNEIRNCADRYFTDRDMVAFLTLLTEMHELSEKYTGILAGLSAFDNILEESGILDEPSTAVDNDNDKIIPLTMHYANTLEIQDIGEKLMQLKAMYDAVCKLLEIDSAKYPLKLKLIETGSTIFYLLGSIGAITFMRGVFTRALQLWDRNYTTQGQLDYATFEHKRKMMEAEYLEKVLLVSKKATPETKAAFVSLIETTIGSSIHLIDPASVALPKSLPPALPEPKQPKLLPAPNDKTPN